VTARAYHHGDLPRALLDVTARVVAENGPTSWSLREIARRAGVSHAAPAHHFGDKAGLLRALATEGFELLCAEFDRAERESEGRSAIERHIQQGTAYLAFAAAHPGHYDVMFRSDLFEPDEAYLAVAISARSALQSSARRVVVEAGGTDEQVDLLATASWSLAHGLTGLIGEGFVEPDAAVAEAVLRQCLAGGGFSVR
jgi:AcrR family transcriptional regulator